MIVFTCPCCGSRFRVPESKAGRKGRCTRCQSVVCIPHAGQAGFREADTQTSWHGFTGELRLKQEAFEAPPESPVQIRADAVNPMGLITDDESEQEPGVRKYPWLIDVLLYPTSVGGMINLAIFWLLPVLLVFIGAFFMLACVGGIVGLLIFGLYYAYMIYYFTSCIRDSSDGGTRAPDTIADSPDMWTAVTQLLEVIGVLALVMVPALVVLIVTRRFDMWFWIAAATGIFVLPMALLAVITFESGTGYNPLVWLTGIAKTFFPYVGLLLLLGPLAVGLVLCRGNILLTGPWIYGMMIGCHLVGRFYFRCEQRLGW